MTEMAEGKQSGYRQLFVNLENNVYRGASQPWNRQLYLHEGDTCLESRLTPSELCNAWVLVHTAVWSPAWSSGSKHRGCAGEVPSSGHLLVDWAVARWWRRAFIHVEHAQALPLQSSVQVCLSTCLHVSSGDARHVFDLWTGLEVHLPLIQAYPIHWILKIDLILRVTSVDTHLLLPLALLQGVVIFTW